MLTTTQPIQSAKRFFRSIPLSIGARTMSLLLLLLCMLLFSEYLGRFVFVRFFQVCVVWYARVSMKWKTLYLCVIHVILFFWNKKTYILVFTHILLPCDSRPFPILFCSVSCLPLHLVQSHSQRFWSFFVLLVNREALIKNCKCLKMTFESTNCLSFGRKFRFLFQSRKKITFENAVLLLYIINNTCIKKVSSGVLKKLHSNIDKNGDFLNGGSKKMHSFEYITTNIFSQRCLRVCAQSANSVCGKRTTSKWAERCKRWHRSGFWKCFYLLMRMLHMTIVCEEETSEFQWNHTQVKISFELFRCFSYRLNVVLFGNLNGILSKFVPIGANAPWETVLRKERQFFDDSVFFFTWPARQFLCFSIGNHWIMKNEHSHTSWASEICL